MAGIITALVVQKRNKQRVNVYLDGEFAFGLALVEAARLRKGQRLTDEDVARLRALDEVEQAHERALHFLSFRPRSAEEVRRNLRHSKQQFSEKTIDSVLERLQGAGLVDDFAFARYWVENREQFGPRSARALRYELRQKGVPDEAVRAAMEELDQDEAAYQAAREVAHRHPAGDERAFRKRLGAHLARRGFDYSTIRGVLDRLWAEMTAQPETPADHE
jgi:regulatory protein